VSVASRHGVTEEAKALLQPLPQIAERPDSLELHAHLREGLGELGPDAGEEAASAEQTDGAGHLDEEVGGPRVDGVDASEIDDDAADFFVGHVADERGGELLTALSVDGADDGKHDDPFPDLYCSTSASFRSSSCESDVSVTASAAFHGSASGPHAAGFLISYAQCASPFPRHIVSIAMTGSPRSAVHQPLA